MYYTVYVSNCLNLTLDMLLNGFRRYSRDAVTPGSHGLLVVLGEIHVIPEIVMVLDNINQYT